MAHKVFAQFGVKGLGDCTRPSPELARWFSVQGLGSRGLEFRPPLFFGEGQGLLGQKTPSELETEPVYVVLPLSSHYRLLDPKIPY